MRKCAQRSLTQRKGRGTRRYRQWIESLEERLLLSVLYTEADFDRMRQGVAAGAQPWVAGYNALVSDGYSQTGWTPRPLQTVIRGGTGENYNQMVIDMERAYQTAVRWKVSGDTAYADQAVTILNAWSSTMTTLTGDADRFLASGLYGFGWAAAADIMSSYSGWASTDQTSFKNYLVNIYYPMQHDFLVNHNTAYITNYWANWDLANVEGMMAVGLFAGRSDLYQEAVNYLYTGKGNGALDKAFYYRHPGNLYQWQESGRDQGHTVLGMQLFGHIAEMAWNQGLDLFSYNNYQFLAAAEYVAKYNLGHDVPYETYNWGTGQSGTWQTQTGISSASRGDMDVGYELIYAHYVEQLGMAAPYTAARIAARGTEGRGSGDEFGFGTLTYRQVPVATAGLTPRGLTAAEKGRGNIQLDWFGTPDATGYNVYRATSATGSYSLVASNVTDLLTYTDRNLAAGTYYYKVTGITGGGETGFSAVVSATSTTVLHTALPFEGDGVDTTGNGHSATLWNGATFATGKTGSALSLDGVDDYVSLPEGFVTDVNDMTISAWVYLNDLRTWSRVFDFGDDRGRWMFLTPRDSNGVVEFATSTVYGYNAQRITGTAALPTNQWVHVAVTLNDKVGRLYVNGVLVGSNTNMSFPLAEFQSTKRNWLGRSQFTADPYLNGRIDEFQIARGAMTSGEVYTRATGQAAPPVPSAPGSLSATAAPGNQVNLNWSAVSGATAGYTVKRGTSSGGPYTVIATRLTGTTYSDTGLVAGVSYYYVVTADNDGGESVPSVEASTMALPPMPSSPTGLSAVPASPTSVLLNWSAASNAATYSVKRSTSSGGPYITVVSGLTGRSFTDSGLSAGTTYWYVVSSVNASGESVNSAEDAVVPGDRLLQLAFDEGSGTTAADSTGNGFGGTLMNGTAWGAGKTGNAVSLDGVDDYISLGSGIVSGLTTATISAWVNVNAFATWARIFDFGTGTTDYMFLTAQYTATSPNNAKLRFAIRTPTVAEQQINSTVAMSAGTWVHVAVVLNGSVGTLYLNGTAVGSNSGMTLNPASLGTTSQNYLGKSQFADPYFNGKLDDFRIYTRALSATEVQNLVNLPPTVATDASAAPTPVTGTTTSLSVLGTDDAGEPGLTYTWAASGPAAVAYSDNGTNTAKNTTATFTQAGSYTFTATITDAGGLTVSSNVTVTVDQTLASVTVSPASATLHVNRTQQFSAVAYDQFGQALSTQPTFTWSATNGTIDSSGLYTAPAAAGSATITATATGVSGSSAVTVIAQFPSAPSNLTLTGLSRRRVRLNWRDNSIDETGFYIWSSRDGITWTLFATTAAVSGSGSTVSYTTSSLSTGTWYFRVSAFNADGQSAYSNTTTLVV